MTNKLDALVHCVCARCEDPGKLGATKLNKILWYVDVRAYAMDGVSVTGTLYIKRQFGPVPKDIMKAREWLVRAGAISERTVEQYGYEQTQFIALQAADVSMFSASQISLIDSVMGSVCLNHTASSISALSHDIIWEMAEIGEEIPMAAAAFGGQIGDLDQDDLAWAEKELDRIEAC